MIRAAVIVTGRPMSTSRPVPGYRFSNWAVVYQSVCHAVAGLLSIAMCARSLLSPRGRRNRTHAALAGEPARGGAARVVAAGAEAACDRDHEVRLRLLRRRGVLTGRGR